MKKRPQGSDPCARQGQPARPHGQTAGPSGQCARLCGQSAGLSGQSAGPSGHCARPSSQSAGPSGDRGYSVGLFECVHYNCVWILVQVEGQEEEEENGYTLVNFKERKGHNSFKWGAKDQLNVLIKHILMEVSLSMVKWSIFKFFPLCFLLK